MWTDARNGDYNVYAQRVQYNGTLGGGTVDVPRDLSIELALDPVRPNPVRGGPVTVSFSLATGGDASLELVDVSGRRLASRDLSSFAAGRHVLALAPEHHPAPGIYLVRLRQGGIVRLSRVAVLD
jgi:hypothetical protein